VGIDAAGEDQKTLRLDEDLVRGLETRRHFDDLPVPNADVGIALSFGRYHASAPDEKGAALPAIGGGETESGHGV
jgi:hypothetical protein